MDQEEARPERMDMTGSSEDTSEMINPALKAMQGSFLPALAWLDAQKVTGEVDPEKLIDEDQGLTLLHSAAYYGKMKPLRTLVEHFGADPSYPDYRG